MKKYLGFSQYRVVCCAAVFIALMAVWPSAQAAYCSLRDPIMAIRTLYPEADQHRSIVKTIGRDTRDHISKRLPFTLHFNELGRHTLYVAQQQDLPLGFVHARSEASEWGLIEIAWAISPHLKIEGFYFQRCRSPACNDDLRKQVSGEIVGKSLDEILSLITPDGNDLIPAIASKYQKNNALVLSIIRSALKTIAATEYGWHEDVTQLRRRSMAMRWLDNKKVPELLPVIKSDELEIVQMPASVAPAYAFVEQSSIQAFRVMVDGVEVARLVDATWRLGEQSGDFSWLFSKTGEILGIESYHPMPDRDAELAFNQMVGQDVVAAEQCSDATEITGNTLFLNAYNRIEVINRED